jgi:alpha-N-acetylglucosaminidase
MSLQGINIFLAMTGQEEVQYKAFRKFGIGDREIREFFNGPAFLTWSRGQSMQSVGSSALPRGGESGLPRSWMQAQWRLQKFILGRARSLGIVGVLPAFQGNLPPQIKTLQPTANISITRHSDGYNDSKGQCAWLAASDPLFGRIADAWMEIMLADWGTDHWYQCDGFFTGAKPPWYDAAATSADETGMDSAGGKISADPPIDPSTVGAAPDWLPVWKGAWEGMAKTDPQARWLYQGWAIRTWSDAAGASRLKALYESVPHGQWVPLDMDIGGIWKYWGNYSFFGAPFIWTTIHNMGGNDGMKGDMRMLTDLPSQALSAGASIIGTGATPEGIDQNPVYYEYLFDTAWHASPQSLETWFATYPTRRYGKATTQATAAWKLLGSTVYQTQV